MGSTYLQCFWNGNTVGETKWCQAIADRTKDQVNTAIVGETDMLASTETVRKHLQEHMQYKNFRGIRFCISNDSKKRPHTHDFLDVSKGENTFADPQFIKNLEPYAEFGLSYDVWWWVVRSMVVDHFSF